MSQKKQTFENHKRFVPIYHFVAFPILVAGFITSIVRAVRTTNYDTILAAAMGFAFIVLFFAMRIFALTVQDRVIRLEMQLRMKELLPKDLYDRTHELSVKQLVALRFAGDRELKSLVERVLDERIRSADAIKRAIVEWRADHQRC